MAVVRLWFVFASLCIFQMCSATGTFYFRMRSYSTNCEEFFNGCDVMFKFCFDRPKSNPSVFGCALHTTRESSEHNNAESLSFSNSIRGIPNPIVFNVQSFPEAGVMVVIRLMDHNIAEGNDLILIASRTLTFTPAASARYTDRTYTVRDSEGYQHTFKYSFKAHCTTGYFGRSCAKACVPTNSTSGGHYTCSSNGEKICLSGWEGNNCKADVNECLRTPDICETTTSTTTTTSTSPTTTTTSTSPTTTTTTTNNNTTTTTSPTTTTTTTTLSRVCVNTDGSYRCDCPAGWKGEHCDQDVDECEEVAYPLCLNGGNCTNAHGSFRCICPANWTGPNCTYDVDECSTMTSSCAEGNRRCNNTFGGYQCICNAGWTGGNCDEDVDECRESNSTCSNNTIGCINTAGGYRCQCADGWTGADCLQDFDECRNQKKERVCLLQDTCENRHGSFLCHCGNGTVGCYYISGGVNKVDEDDEFIWWPIILVIVLLIIIVIIVVIIFLVSRRRRGRFRKRTNRPPSVLELQAASNGVSSDNNTATTTGITSGRYRGEMLMFENSLYYANRNRNRPTSTSSSSTTTDPATREPMRLPDPDPRKYSADYHEIDLNVYHDLDVYDDPKKRAADAAPTPAPGSVQPDGKAKNLYANGLVGLDTRPQAGLGNQYEDFNGLNLKADNKPAAGTGEEGGGGGGLDAAGYTMPSLVVPILKRDEPNEPKSATEDAKLVEAERGAAEEGLDNPAFRDDDDELPAPVWPGPWVAEGLSNGDAPIAAADDERDRIPQALDKRDDSTAENAKDDDDDAGSLSWPQPPLPELEELDSALLGHPYVEDDGDYDDSDSDGVLEFIERRRRSRAAGEGDRMDLRSLGETTTDDIDSLRGVLDLDTESPGATPADRADSLGGEARADKAEHLGGTPADDADSPREGAPADDADSLNGAPPDGFDAENPHLWQYPLYELAKNTKPNAYF